jgi:exodeoxyribonuclease VII small subunit
MTETTFREAYGVLQQHAETLREQSEPNIDQLLTIVTESVAAYKTCKLRIDAVEKALEAALTNAAIDAPSAAPSRSAARPPARPASAAAPPTGPGEEDDVPF